MTTHYPHSYPTIPQTETGLPLPTPELLAKEAAAGVIPISFPAIAIREDDVFEVPFLLGMLELGGYDVIVEPFSDK
jgi:hypothetical protein